MQDQTKANQIVHVFIVLYNLVKLNAITVTSQWVPWHLITGISIVCSGTYQIKHQSSVSLAFLRGIHRSTVDSPHKRPVTQKRFPLTHVIMGKPSVLLCLLLHTVNTNRSGWSANWFYDTGIHGNWSMTLILIAGLVECLHVIYHIYRNGRGFWVWLTAS